MRQPHRWVLSIAIVCCGCLPPPSALLAAEPVVEVDADAKADFAAYRTFRVDLRTPLRTERARREVVEAVTRAVDKRGLDFDGTDPDVVVRTYILVDAHSLEELSDESEWEFWTGVRNVSAYDLGEGTLVIDFVDTESGQVVWRGLTTERLSKSVEANYERLPKIVRRLLKRYPPKSG